MRRFHGCLLSYGRPVCYWNAVDLYAYICNLLELFLFRRSGNTLRWYQPVTAMLLHACGLADGDKDYCKKCHWRTRRHLSCSVLERTKSLVFRRTDVVEIFVMLIIIIAFLNLQLTKVGAKFFYVTGVMVCGASAILFGWVTMLIKFVKLTIIHK